MSTFVKRSVAQQWADYYVANANQIGAKSVLEMATENGISRSQARQSLPLINEQLALRGETLIQANRASGWRVEPTNSLVDFAMSTRDRNIALASEAAKNRKNAHSCSVSDPTLLQAYDDLEVAVSTILAAIP
jgi:hypothetical protein